MKNFFKKDYKKIAEKAKYKYNREQAVSLYHDFLNNIKIGICKTIMYIDAAENLDEEFITKYLNGKNISITFDNKRYAENYLSNMHIKVTMTILE